MRQFVTFVRHQLIRNCATLLWFVCGKCCNTELRRFLPNTPQSKDCGALQDGDTQSKDCGTLQDGARRRAIQGLQHFTRRRAIQGLQHFTRRRQSKDCSTLQDGYTPQSKDCSALQDGDTQSLQDGGRTVVRPSKCGAFGGRKATHMPHVLKCRCDTFVAFFLTRTVDVCRL